MFLRPPGWVLATVILLHTTVADAAGIDEVYNKPASAKSWGELLAEFLGVRGVGKSYALVVGISDYRGGFTPLMTTRSDPIRMRDFLLHEAGFDLVHVLTDDKATKARIEELMVDELPGLIRPNDRFLFFWSGHGTQRANAVGGHVGYLPLAASPIDRFATMISMSDIQRWNSLIRAEQTLFLLDACFSGLAGSESKSGELTDLTVAQLSQSAHHLITAGTDEEQTIAGDIWGGSIFTNAVLRGLRGEADYTDDGVVSLSELFLYVRQQVATEKQRAGWSKAITPQLRDLRSNRGEFFFLTNAKKIAALEEAGGRPTGEFEYGLPVVTMGDAADAGRSTVAPAPPVDPEAERLFWDTIKHETDPAYFVEYLRLVDEQRFAGIFVGLARLKLQVLEREPAPGHSTESAGTALDAGETTGPAIAAMTPESTSEPSRTPTVVGPEATEAALRLTVTQWREIQRALATLGHDPGPPDGKPGPRTQEALRAWQQAQGAEATGYLAPEQHEALIAAASEMDVAVGVFTHDVIKVSGNYPEPLAVFKDCAECPEMVVLPGGTFAMGSPEGEVGRSSNEGPQRDVTVAPFALGKHEVTFSEWDACVEDGGCSHRPDDEGWGRGRRPVINVSWEDAQQYVVWLGRKTGEVYRLPTEAEWEYAARARTTTPFWTGATISTAQANYSGALPFTSRSGQAFTTYGSGREAEYRQRTTPVDAFPGNPWGLHDMHGNVWEWVEDTWHGSYEGAPSDGSAWVAGGSSARVFRGGSWYNSPGFVRSAFRNRDEPDLRLHYLGFRVARALTP